MQPEFWHKRWEQNLIGFHQQQVNQGLQQYWPGLGLPAGARVLVPLCGKSRDLAWLSEQGYRVLGVELSERAVEDFFSEQGQVPQVSRQGAFQVYRSQAIEVWCGDFFALTPADTADCAGFYDRAASIALPLAMRERYVKHLQALLPGASAGLLITLEYDQHLIEGPPFAVPDEEVQRLWGEQWHPRLLATDDVLAQSPKYLKAGATQLLERTYRLQR
ncbi:thiopurine S-methyltransferase [Pseudomonas sp. MAFF212428]|uniref:Thiopurine S-methyltransferase n=1 Tax=Pseudomonas brassicae TaxID=2708063 RepID=A0A6B3P1A7_9PSED|nr:thiopurine S-methyltransferase [Pseudomonas brassicae]NER58832.1 thiopurine S-methyltransferase [Pseudomonas brassicae]NER65534.1 thiopurine S-methyltransferase [Pseudomonas brassicae]